jgi:hypothetical protein
VNLTSRFQLVPNLKTSEDISLSLHIYAVKLMNNFAYLTLLPNLKINK